MKTLAIIFFISTLSFSQDRSTIPFCDFYEINPQIVGGLDSLLSRIVYPDSAIRYKIEGQVYVHAYLDSLGNLDSTRVIRGIGFGCDEEVLRVVSLSKFTPAYHYKVISSSGEVEKRYSLVPVRSVFGIPIKFKLQ